MKDDQLETIELLLLLLLLFCLWLINSVLCCTVREAQRW